MSKTLYEVPFTLTIKGSCFVLAAGSDHAIQVADEMVKADWENFAEAAFLFDPANADRVEIETNDEEELPQVEFQTALTSDRKLDEFDYTLDS